MVGYERIIVVAATDEMKDVTDITIPKMQDAADRWEARLIVLRDMPRKYQHPKFRIFEMGDPNSEIFWDMPPETRVLILDADILPHITEQNPFEVLTGGTHMLDEAAKHSGHCNAFDWQWQTHKADMAARAAHCWLDSVEINHWYNPGVTMTTMEDARKIFKMPPWDVDADINLWEVQNGKRIVKNMPWINYLIESNGINVSDLPHEWHAFANGREPIDTAHFIHCSGNEFDKDRLRRKAEVVWDVCRRLNKQIDAPHVLHFVVDKRHKGVGGQSKWILWRLQEELAKHNDTDYVIDEPTLQPVDRPGYVNFYNPYRHYYKRSRFARDVVFFTHPGDMERWNDAMQCDAAIVMCRQYRRALIDAGMHWKRIHRIHLGIDEQYRDCSLRIFHPGRMIMSGEYQARKGWDYWQQLMALDWLHCIRSEGLLTDEQMHDEYLKADVVVSAATMEGGPMGCIEALAMGKQYVGRAGVGVHDEYAPYIKRYADYDELIKILEYEYKVKHCRQTATTNNAWPLCAKQIWDIITGTVQMPSSTTKVSTDSKGRQRRVTPVIVNLKNKRKARR